VHDLTWHPRTGLAVLAGSRSDAFQWLLLISTHGQRHILQIREIKAAPGFPKQ
jgi:hypothetical protein